MRDPDRSRDDVERHTGRLRRELYFRSHVEEGIIARDQVMCDAGGFVENIDLARENELGLFEIVGCRHGRPRRDFVEARGYICGAVGCLCADTGGGQTVGSERCSSDDLTSGNQRQLHVRPEAEGYVRAPRP
jgi:hypothetical protein